MVEQRAMQYPCYCHVERMFNMELKAEKAYEWIAEWVAHCIVHIPYYVCVCKNVCAMYMSTI